MTFSEKFNSTLGGDKWNLVLQSNFHFWKYRLLAYNESRI